MKKLSPLQSSSIFLCLSALAHLIVSSFNTYGDVIHPFLFQTSRYLRDYALAFIILISILFYFIQKLFMLPSLNIKVKILKYLFFYVIWVIGACILCSLLWSYLDMEAGYFPKGNDFLEKLIKDVCRGVIIGPIVIFAASIPYNLILFFSSLFLLRRSALFNSNIEQANY